MQHDLNGWNEKKRNTADTDPEDNQQGHLHCSTAREQQQTLRYFTMTTTIRRVKVIRH